MTPLYCDSSALLSLLVTDEHTAAARRAATGAAELLVSSLTLAETWVVLHRIVRQRGLTAAEAGSLGRSIRPPRFRHLIASPTPALLENAASRHALRGTDLWHLAMVLTLAGATSEIRILSFDRRLSEAARHEGLAAG